MNDKQRVVKIRKWAEAMVNCSHSLCSTAEASYENMFGREALDILNGKPLWYEKAAAEKCGRAKAHRLTTAWWAYGGNLFNRLTRKVRH